MLTRSWVIPEAADALPQPDNLEVLIPARHGADGPAQPTSPRGLGGRALCDLIRAGGDTAEGSSAFLAWAAASVTAGMEVRRRVLLSGGLPEKGTGLKSGGHHGGTEASAREREPDARLAVRVRRDRDVGCGGDPRVT
jgi:hypothetical protein